MHIGGMMIFEGPPPSGEELHDHIESRLHLVPRYRQKLAFPRLEMGRPLWVDDPRFNIDYHVRHTALPAPGSVEQLRLLAGADLLPAPRPLEAAVGGLARRGPRGRPLRADQQDPPLPRGRRLRRGPHGGALRPRPRAGRDVRAGGRVGARPGALRRGARGPGRAGPGQGAVRAGRRRERRAPAPRRGARADARGGRGPGRGGLGDRRTARRRRRST